MAEGGRPVRGAEAILLALGAATGVARLARGYRRPWLRRSADGIYAWFARHRGSLPGIRPYCEAHPAECGRPADSADRS
jgi:predicted DCC family thiol-disulfide oxidoreductase YuxK